MALNCVKCKYTLDVNQRQLCSCSSPLERSAQQRVDYGPLPALVGRPLLGKSGAAVSQLLAVLVEAADGVVADAAPGQPDPARSVAQRQGLQEAALGDASRVQDLAVPSSDPDRARPQQPPEVDERGAHLHLP